VLQELFPNFTVNLLESFFHALLDLLSFPAKVFEFSEMFHPGPLLGSDLQFFLNRLGDELAQRNAFRRQRLGPAEQEISDFESRLHLPILPYLWAQAI